MNLLDLPRAYAPFTSDVAIQASTPIAELLRTGFDPRDPLEPISLGPPSGASPNAGRTTHPLLCHATSEAAEIAVARELVRKRYAWRGYRVVETPGSAFPDETRASHYLTIVAKSPNATVGTVTLGIDSTHGLLVDEANKREADRLRARGRRLCELVRLAVEDGVNSKAVLASLFQCVYTIGRCMHDLTDVLIEVNPRHVPFYRRVFGFICASEEKICERVGAISVLLSLDISSLEERFLLPPGAPA